MRKIETPTQTLKRLERRLLQRYQQDREFARNLSFPQSLDTDDARTCKAGSPYRQYIYLPAEILEEYSRSTVYLIEDEVEVRLPNSQCAYDPHEEMLEIPRWLAQKEQLIHPIPRQSEWIWGYWSHKTFIADKIETLQETLDTLEKIPF
jgi:hypothetical protein